MNTVSKGRCASGWTHICPLACGPVIPAPREIVPAASAPDAPDIQAGLRKRHLLVFPGQIIRQLTPGQSAAAMKMPSRLSSLHLFTRLSATRTYTESTFLGCPGSQGIRVSSISCLFRLYRQLGTTDHKDAGKPLADPPFSPQNQHQLSEYTILFQATA